MSTLPSAIRIAVGLGLTGSAWCAGAIMSISTVSVPSLMDPSLPSPASAHASCIWHNIYNRGKAMIPPIAVCTATAFVYAAYTIPNSISSDSNQSTRNLLYAAGLITVGIVPFTLLVMKSTNDALHAKAKAVQETSRLKGLESDAMLLDDGTKELLNRWSMLNFIRGMFPLAAAGIGMVAVLF